VTGRLQSAPPQTWTSMQWCRHIWVTPAPPQSITAVPSLYYALPAGTVKGPLNAVLKPLHGEAPPPNALLLKDWLLDYLDDMQSDLKGGRIVANVILTSLAGWVREWARWLVLGVCVEWLLRAHCMPGGPEQGI